jgi:hypothetical protein
MTELTLVECTQYGVSRATLIDAIHRGLLLALDTAVRQALRELTDAAEAFIADQTGATDPRCGLTQPVTVAEAERLNRAYHGARTVLNRIEP